MHLELIAMFSDSCDSQILIEPMMHITKYQSNQ